MHQRYGRRIPLTSQQGMLLASLSWLVPTVTVILSMSVHLIGGARTFPIFISEADHPGPERFIFTAGIIITGVLQMLYSWHLYHSLTTEKPRLWTVACFIGLVVGFHVILVAYYNMYDHINPHIYAAMISFGGGIIWAITGHIALGTSSVRGAKLRKIGISLSLIALVVMVVSFQYAVGTFDTNGLTTEEFLNNAQSGINFAGPAEYILVSGLLMALASFRQDLAGQQKNQQADSETIADQINYNDI